MRILIIGGGAREHALAWKLSAEQPTGHLVCAPGNPGMATVAKCVSVDQADPEALFQLAEHEDSDLTVIGPELPLAKGVADRFAAGGRLLFGPTQAAARLESSKAFAKPSLRPSWPDTGYQQRRTKFIPTYPAHWPPCDRVDSAIPL